MTKKEIIIEEYNRDPNFNRHELSIRCGIDPSFIRKIIRKIKRAEIRGGREELSFDSGSQESMEFNRTSENAAKLQLSSKTVTTLEQALEVAKVDLTEWEVDRYTIGSYQSTVKEKTATGTSPKTITMYKIQVWLKQINVVWVKAIRELIKEIPKIETVYEKKLGDPTGDYMLEVALMDVHFGMLAWGKETVHDYDLDIAEDLYLHAVQDLLQKTKGFPISRILFPVGNDFLHIDDPTNLTPQHHNILDADGRLIKIYTKAKKAVIKAVDYCRQVAPVDIQWIPGNHDPNISYYLCDVIKEVFSEAKDVTVDVSPRWRKFYPWGKSLLCLTHGQEERLIDLPSIMATEEPKLWGESIYREIHIGHKHKKRELRWVGVDTFPGCVVRMIPSICSEDAWSYRKGFMRGWYAAESYLWNAKTGMEAQFTSFMDYSKYKEKDKRTGVPVWKLNK
jgi:hypothetical protein